MRCSKCGGEIKDTDKFCKYCGNKIENNNHLMHNTNEPNLVIPRKKSNAGLIVGIFIGLIILLIVALALLSKGAQTEKQNNEIEKIIENNDEDKTGQNDKTST